MPRAAWCASGRALVRLRQKEERAARIEKTGDDSGAGHFERTEIERAAAADDRGGRCFEIVDFEQHLPPCVALPSRPDRKNSRRLSHAAHADDVEGMWVERRAFNEGPSEEIAIERFRIRD